MATFGSIQGAEPSTVTFELRTVKINQNSTLMHQEIMSLGDPDTSNAIAAVLNTSPASTAWGLAVRPVGTLTVSVANSLIDENNYSTASGGGQMEMGLTFSGAIGSVANAQSAAIALDVKRSQHIVIRDAGLNARGANVNAANALQVDGQSTCIQGTSPWIIAGNSTVAPLAGSTWATRPIQSSAADLQMTATPAAGSTWRVQPGSTLWASSAGFHFDSSGSLLIAGTFSAAFSSTKADNLVTVYQSSAAELNASVQPIAGSTWRTQPGSTLWASSAGFHFDSSGALQTNGQLSGTVGLDFNTMQSSVAPSSGSSGLIVRQVIDNLITTASTNAFVSTSLVIQTSGAALRSYVTAYSILTTNAGPTKIAFYSSGVVLWPMVLAAISSAVTGVNLAVSPPGYLFRTIGAADALTLQTKGSSGTGWHVGVSYYRAP